VDKKNLNSGGNEMVFTTDEGWRYIQVSSRGSHAHVLRFYNSEFEKGFKAPGANFEDTFGSWEKVTVTKARELVSDALTNDFYECDSSEAHEQNIDKLVEELTCL
jgi:hypothetical protein